jgi:hypothetical protein
MFRSQKLCVLGVLALTLATARAAGNGILGSRDPPAFVVVYSTVWYHRAFAYDPQNFQVHQFLDQMRSRMSPADRRRFEAAWTSDDRDGLLHLRYRWLFAHTSPPLSYDEAAALQRWLLQRGHAADVRPAYDD